MHSGGSAHRRAPLARYPLHHRRVMSLQCWMPISGKWCRRSPGTVSNTGARFPRIAARSLRETCLRTSSLPPLRWREPDSNPRSPVRRTTLFETPLSQHARHRRLPERSPPRPAAASSRCRSRSDERRTHSPTRRSSGPPDRRHHHPFALITALCFFRVRFISCSCAVALSRGRAPP